MIPPTAESNFRTWPRSSLVVPPRRFGQNLIRPWCFILLWWIEWIAHFRNFFHIRFDCLVCSGDGSRAFSSIWHVATSINGEVGNGRVRAGSMPILKPMPLWSESVISFDTLHHVWECNSDIDDFSPDPYAVGSLAKLGIRSSVSIRCSNSFDHFVLISGLSQKIWWTFNFWGCDSR